MIQDLLNQIPIPQRLLAGAKLLGNLWRQKTRCQTGWNVACYCESPTKFCVAKRQWVLMATKVGRGMAEPDRASGLLVAFTANEFDATGVTMTIETPSGQTVKIGPGKTNLRAYLDIPQESMEAVELVLKVFPDAVVVPGDDE